MIICPMNETPPTPSAPDLAVEQLSIRYGKHTAVHEVTWHVEPGQIAAVIGPSGCGKSSFLTSLNRLTDLVPRCEVTGHIRVGELDVRAPQTDVIHLRRQVGMIFQRPNPFPTSVFHNLALPLREHGMRDKREIESLAESTLRDVGLWEEVKDRLHRSALLLSGGQQQRLCLARALVLRPAVLLLDEPCSALDPLSAGVVEELIGRLKRCYTIVIVTHNLAQAQRLADQVALFWTTEQGGQLIEQGPAESLFAAPQHELTAAYLAGRVG